VSPGWPPRPNAEKHPAETNQSIEPIVSKNHTHELSDRQGSIWLPSRFQASDRTEPEPATGIKGQLRHRHGFGCWKVD
jgi:hypothetical protein